MLDPSEPACLHHDTLRHSANEPYDVQNRVTAAVSWVLSHQEVTGIPTPGDVGLLAMMLKAEQERIAPDEAEQRLDEDDLYASPFLSMPF